MLRLIVVWLHVVAAAAWIGGLLHTMHLIAPAAARGGPESLELLARARPMTWGALAILVLTGLENLRAVGLGSPWLAAKLMAVIALLALAAHRDFAVLPRAIRAVADGAPSAAALSGVRTLDRVLLLLALAAVFLAVGVARGR
jgi:uncharacterized membrane protein